MAVRCFVSGKQVVAPQDPADPQCDHRALVQLIGLVVMGRGRLRRQCRLIIRIGLVRQGIQSEPQSRGQQHCDQPIAALSLTKRNALHAHSWRNGRQGKSARRAPGLR